MADETTTEARTAEKTSVVDIRTRDLSEFDDGEAIRVHYRDAPDQPHKCLTGRITFRWNDYAVLLETDDGRELKVDLSERYDDNIRDWNTDEYLGRGMFAETAYHPEQDGEALRAELLGDNDENDENDGNDDNDDNDQDVETDGGQDEKVAEPVTETLDVEEGDEIELEYVIAIGDHAGNENTHRGTVTNVSKAGALIQYRTPGAKGTSTVSLRSGAIHVQNTFKDIHVGRDATVTVLEGDE